MSAHGPEAVQAILCLLDASVSSNEDDPKHAEITKSDKIIIEGRPSTVNTLVENVGLNHALRGDEVIWCCRDALHDVESCSCIHSKFEYCSVEGKPVKRIQLVENFGLDQLLRTPSVTGSWCMDTSDTHNATLCNFIHAKDEKLVLEHPCSHIVVEDDYVSVAMLVYNDAVAYYRKNRTYAAMWCSNVNRVHEHDIMKCPYIHAKNEYIVVNSYPVRKELLLQNASYNCHVGSYWKRARWCMKQFAHNIFSCEFIHYNSSQKIVRYMSPKGMRFISANELVENSALKYLLQNSDRIGRLCVHEGNNSHEAVNCKFLHRKSN